MKSGLYGPDSPVVPTRSPVHIWRPPQAPVPIPGTGGDPDDPWRGEGMGRGESRIPPELLGSGVQRDIDDPWSGEGTGSGHEAIPASEFPWLDRGTGHQVGDNLCDTPSSYWQQPQIDIDAILADRTSDTPLNPYADEDKDKDGAAPNKDKDGSTPNKDKDVTKTSVTKEPLKVGDTDPNTGSVVTKVDKAPAGSSYEYYYEESPPSTGGGSGSGSSPNPKSNTNGGSSTPSKSNSAGWGAGGRSHIDDHGGRTPDLGNPGDRSNTNTNASDGPSGASRTRDHSGLDTPLGQRSWTRKAKLGRVGRKQTPGQGPGGGLDPHRLGHNFRKDARHPLAGGRRGSSFVGRWDPAQSKIHPSKIGVPRGEQPPTLPGWELSHVQALSLDPLRHIANTLRRAGVLDRLAAHVPTDLLARSGKRGMEPHAHTTGSATSDPILGGLPGSHYGAMATAWYADRYVHTGELKYYAGGLLAALWTPETSRLTCELIAIALGIDAVYGIVTMDREPPGPAPPGWTPDWQTREAEGTSMKYPEQKSYMDPEGGEWKYDPGSANKSPHWDYNPWTDWNSPWENRDLDGKPITVPWSEYGPGPTNP